MSWATAARDLSDLAGQARAVGGLQARRDGGEQLGPPSPTPVRHARRATVHHGHEACLLQTLDRLADGVAVHAERLAQGALGWQWSAGLCTGAKDLVAQAAVDGIRNRRSAMLPSMFIRGSLSVACVMTRGGVRDSGGQTAQVPGDT